MQHLTHQQPSGWLSGSQIIAVVKMLALRVSMWFAASLYRNAITYLLADAGRFYKPSP